MIDGDLALVLIKKTRVREKLTPRDLRTRLCRYYTFKLCRLSYFKVCLRVASANDDDDFSGWGYDCIQQGWQRSWWALRRTRRRLYTNHSRGHAGSSPAHSAHHGEHSEHHEGHIGDHGHFRHFHDIHHIVHHRFGGGLYCLSDSFYYDETGVRHCCNTPGQPCFPLPASQKEITE